ncbi:DegT/DnrJ/EryC1/StrS family aminotransferase [Campylobacter corcagiensis]|uniref:DegT/DnrJ/EryC1/StrS aminotransferase family protein n=1 Tax=Campylobacter corcagiensis TaxID=1448857 RepID=A0A7M1LHK3_9BACT|nr:DegT/DnrJ/EryC1/StrS aminotransferase family protein [Campylobacter corcagiensis]QKF64865.1 aminotransferase, DegT/DnrJ/EryC1/StrS family [Campylobacter corcagiensis]QOQ86975.1 DegT/DnrJ/EryC1/StrS aminotransferase family protein [Campylobacter corcagiensis]
MQEIPFFRPAIDDKELNLIKKSLENPDLDMALLFENDIKNYFGSEFAISTNNGTAALHLALCALDIKRADKIICSVNSFPSIAEVIRHFDAEPIFVDIDEDSFNINPASFEKAIKENSSKKLKAAFITHVAGVSADMDAIYEISQKYGIKIIDDASRAAGALYNGKKIGSFKESVISCFQINPQFYKAIATAGFFVTNDEEINSRAKLIRSHAITSNPSKDGSLDYIYDIKEIGQRYDLNSICAAFAKVQFEKNSNFIKRRQEIAKIYDKELENCPFVKTPIPYKNHIYTQYIIKIDKNRDNFAKNLKEQGINVSLHYIPLHLLTYYKQKYAHKVNRYPTALKVYQQVLSLPIFAAMSDEEVYKVCEKVKFVAKNRF